MKAQNKGKVEAEISEAIKEFKTRNGGKAPEEVRSHIVEDMIIVRLRGILTIGEQQLLGSPDGIELVKRCRICLMERAQTSLEKLLQGLFNVKIVTLCVDIQPEIEEMFVILELSENIEGKLQRSSLEHPVFAI